MFWRKAPRTSTDHEIQVHGQRVRWRRRAFQRTLRIQVKPSGEILVTSGRQRSEKEIRAFLAENQEWLKQSLAQAAQMRERHPPKRLYEGEEFLYLGRPRRLHFRCVRAPRLEFQVRGETLEALVPENLWTQVDLEQGIPEWLPRLRAHYQKQAKALLTSRVEAFSRLMGLFPRSISIRGQRTRWGSCSARGEISLNWRLLALRLELIDYVVIHELAHLKHPNHSAAFWALVAVHCPNFKELRRELRRNHFATDFLIPRSELHSSGAAAID